jgi:hypothetical protein
MTTFRSLVLAAAMLTLGATVTQAVCTPFGGDDTGCLTADKTKGVCESKVAKNVAKMWKAFLKCHSKQAASVLAGKPFAEDPDCEGDAVTKWVFSTDTTACPCVNKNTIATAVENVLDMNNNLTFCDPGGAPFGGEDTGNVPTNKDVLRCETGLVKCWTKLVKSYFKCHINAEAAFLKSKTFDEEACEEGPLAGKSATEAYNTCVMKVMAKGGCNGCENPAQVLTTTDSNIDSTNNSVYCEM